MENGQLCDTKIKSSVDDLITLKDEMAEKVKKEMEVKANKPKRRLPGDKAALLDNEDPPDNYRWLSVIPQQNDVHPNGPVFIRRNKVEGSYDGPEHYLDVQFRLLREDFIRPLREGIASLTESDGTRYAKPTQDIRVYNRVEILDPVYTSKGVVYNIRFDANRMRYVRWENSKRLIYGSLLCLSKDNFETFILATVEERKPCDLRKGILKVRFKNVYEEFRKEVRYQMVETTAYYEAYCHVLEGLQEISPKNFPFEQYIVKSEPDVQAPFYLRSSEKGDVTYDLSCIMKGDNERVLLSHRKKGSRVKMLDLDSWPSAKDLELDDSQLKAVQLALTKEFAIIQGPPGTGKTYIGLKVAKVLLNNKVHWNNVTSALDKDYRYNLQRTRPILVVCYTNHALDQFLEGIHEFHPEGIVRVGGRSQSEKMQACSLRTIKEGIRQRYKGKRNFTPNISQFLGVGHEQKEIRRGFYEAYEELELISKEMENVKYKIQLLTRNVIDEQELRAKDYMSEKHYKSLVARFKDIHGLGIKIKPNVMHYWLELLTNKFDFFESGYFIKPTVVYPLTATSNASLGLETRYLEPAVGPDGNDDGSSVLTASSYIIIPNEQGSLLDMRYSITILLYFYPLGPEGGPIITFYGCGSIGIQISQEGEENGKGVLSATFNSRYGECPMQPLVTKGVLKLLEWNCIGATYDYSSGILRLWHDGIMVQEQQYPRMEIASHLPVYIGAINRTFHKKRLHLLGKVSSLQFYTQAIGQEQIMAMAGLPTDGMSGAPQRGHQGGRNKRGRGGASFGRGMQRWSHDRNDASNGGAEVQLNLQADRGRARGSRGRSRGRGIGRGGNFFRNESATENGERFGINHDQGRGRGTSGRSRDEVRVSSGRNIQGNGSDNESEGAWGPLGRQRGTSRGSTRGGRSRDTNADEQLDYKSLSSMLIIKEPDELVLDLTSDRYFPAFESLLSQHDLPDKKVVVILKIFARACDSETSRTFLIRMLNKLVSSVYLSCELTRYINCLGYSARDDERDLDNELMCMVKVFTELLKRLPTSFPNLPLPNLLHATNALMKNDQLCDEVIKSSVNNLIALKDEMAEKVKKEVEVKANKPKRRQPGDEALLDNEDPPENYRFLNVIPEGSDVHPTEPVFFRRNKVEGSYDGPEHYLDVQFRLLREDFMRPLREGIASLTESIETGGKKKSQDIRVYSGVKILDPVCTSKGVIHEISFDVSKLNMRVQWKNSKRLIYGSLLCLSRDNFETFLLATVETREEKQLKQGILQVRFTDVHADFGKETYQMVETTAYFEAYRHVLEGLQEIRPYNFPFERYIVKSETDVQVPLYLRNASKDVTYDLTCIMRSQSEKSTGIEYHSGQQAGKSVRILDVNSWPSAEDLGLDDSQLKAVQLALTKEFAIIQGPPGTGKTYIGLKVAKALLKNKIHWHYRIASTLEERRFWETKLRKRPLLLVCYTNHALDQFLEGIQKFHPEGIVRVGGQSRSRELEECNLRSIKQAIREYHKEVCRYHRRLRQRELRKKSGRYHYNRFGGYSYYDDSTDEEYEDEEEELEYPEISSELLEIYNNQYWIRSKFKELYQELNITSQQLQHINFSIQKTKTTVINENQLLSEGHMSIENYNSIVARFKEADGMKIKVKPDAMHYWLKLLTNTSELIESGSSFVSPVAVYPLSAESSRSNTLNSSEKLVFHNATPAFGIDEQPNHSFRIAENDSYILIPNMENSLLDTRFSITILLYVYTVHFSSSGSKGPILTFHQDGNIGIQIRQEGHVLSVTFNSRDGLLSNSLVTDAVLEWNEWNYIAVSYDYGTGILRVYHNGQMVKEQQNASMEIASHMPIHIGSLDLPDDKSSFYGLVSSLQFYPEAISQKQIKAIAGIPEEDSKEIEKPLEEDNEDPAKASDERQVNIVFEADAMEGLRRLDVDVDDVYYSQSLRQDLDVSSYEPHYAAQGEWEMQCSKFTKKRVKQLLDREMAKTDMMTDDEAKNVTDVWKISQQDKWRLYRYWIEKMREPYKTKARRLYPKFEECAERLKALQGQEDLTILEKATIIGMTTTGAAKFRGLIQKTKPCITIVEEAAEVLESHIVTSLNPGCQHLILIGDHQQLRPSPNVYELAKDYKLDVSLFERMVINRLDYQTLHKQRRMRPEIARMMRPIYDNLENHESVLNFENIKGVNKNIFFIEHNELEDFVEEGRSRSNIHEARYLAALCRYFILQGYDQERITILTMYTGQLNQLKKEMPKEFFGGVRICAVDNFQGEENDIILLSLVRSNEEENIGFLRISNRVCVALSRARKGFYCIGNLELICKKDKLWAKIIEDMRERGNVGRSLTLVCRNHPSTIIHASKRDDFQRAPQGGCTLPCHARLDCGHACRLRCHPTDTDHTEYECLEPCTKTLCDLGHKCKKRCFDNCGVCRVPRDKIMPACNHIQNLPCYVEPASVKCGVSCEVLKCGHPCAGSCGNCVQGRLHLLCQQNCERTLVCGHKCTENCAKKCPPCSRKCENECVHKKCPNKCCEPCTPCLKMCVWKCEHFKCTMRCCEPCDRPRCNNPCEKTLKCGHPCIGMCGEPCPNKCRVCHKDIVTKNVFGSEDDPEARFVELQPCGHVIEVNAMDALVDECNSGVTLKLQLKGCPICKTPIRTCPRYGNIIKNTLDDIEKVKEKLVSSNNGIKGEAKKLKSMIYFSEKFKNNAYYIQRKLDAKFLSKESLKMFQNQVIFLNLLSKMLAEISNSERDSRNAQGQNRLLKDSLEKEITALKTRGIPLTNEWHSYGMSDQAQEDLRNEILRVQLIVTYRILNGLIQEREAILNDRDEDDMNLIGQAIDSGKCIDEEKRKQHMQTLERICRSCGMLRRYEYSPITKEDTMEITNGIGFTQGNWFKCPLGHIYSTDGEDCPECFQQWSRVIRR